MIVYEDESAFWDDIAGRYILKHASLDQNAYKIVEGAGVYADLMVLQRRKRKRVKSPVKDLSPDAVAT